MSNHYATRNGGPVVGPFASIDEANEFTYQYEETRYPPRPHVRRVMLAAPGWFITSVLTPEQGFEDAREHHKFDIERRDDQRRLNAEEAFREESDADDY